MNNHLRWALRGAMSWLIFGVGGTVAVFDPPLTYVSLRSRGVVWLWLIAIGTWGIVGSGFGLLGRMKANDIDNRMSGGTLAPMVMFVWGVIWGTAVLGVVFPFVIPLIDAAGLRSLGPRCGIGAVLGLLAGSLTSTAGNQDRNNRHSRGRRGGIVIGNPADPDLWRRLNREDDDF